MNKPVVTVQAPLCKVPRVVTFTETECGMVVDQGLDRVETVVGFWGIFCTANNILLFI